MKIQNCGALVACIAVLFASAFPLAAAGQDTSHTSAIKDWIATLDASGWRFVDYTDDGTAMFARPPSSLPSGHRTMWVRYESMDTNAGGDKSLVALFEYDCLGRSKVLQETLYASNNLVAPMQTRSPKDGWIYLIPKSLDEEGSKLACERLKMDHTPRISRKSK